MSDIQKKLALFDKEKEDTKRLITSTRPVRESYPEAGRNYLSEKVKSGEITKYQEKAKQWHFEQEGILGVIESKEEAIELAGAVAMYNFSIQNALISDMAAGLYTMATTGTGLYDQQFSYDDEGDPISLYITMSRETLWKAMFGPLVNDNGFGLPGTSDILRDAKKRILPIITGRIPAPAAFASIYKEKGQGEDPLSIIIKGSPLSVKYGLITSKRNKKGLPIYKSSRTDALTLELDLFFYPIKTTTSGEIMKLTDRYIQQVAGLTTFLQFGSREVDRYLENNVPKEGALPKDRRPDVLTMRKIILAEQTAFQLGRLYPDIIKKNKSGRLNVTLRRGSIKSLYPSAHSMKNNKDYYDFKLFSDVVAHTGRAFNSAIHYTGIEPQLKKQGRIFIPANDHGAEFPKNPDTVVYLKADKK